MSDLKPCPFCGGKASWMIPTSEGVAVMYGISAKDDIKYHHAECEECGNRSAIYNTKEKAIKAWNTRPELIEDIIGGIKAIELDNRFSDHWKSGGLAMKSIILELLKSKL